MFKNTFIMIVLNWKLIEINDVWIQISNSNNKSQLNDHSDTLNKHEFFTLASTQILN